MAALAGGAGGEPGRQAWVALGELVRRPFGRRSGGSNPGETEFAALGEAPGEPARAEALRSGLVARATEDPEFATALAGWRRRAQPLSEGSVTNTISGGTHGGSVIQGRNFSGVTFNGPPTPPAQGR
ncbi:hypothetical protein GCM10023100_20920 [Actinocorallia cavernae]|uniref:Uncharacterized protein n=1 Tax=Actinocorallia cavernae TaxID=328075 RepID=A0ABP8SHP7_9ACTN